MNSCVIYNIVQPGFDSSIDLRFISCVQGTLLTRSLNSLWAYTIFDRSLFPDETSRFFFKIFLIKIVIALFHSSISLFPNVRGENVSQINNQRSLFSHRTKISTLNIESMFSNFRVYTFSPYRPSSSISASTIPRIFYPGMRIISQLIRSKSHRDRVLVHAPCWSSTRVYTAA